MFDAERFKERLAAIGLSQNALARRVGISQQTVSRLAAGGRYGTRHLHRIARELGTTPAYLTGETDDPAEGAPVPPPKSLVQHFSLPVALPAQPNLAAAFEAILLASRDMTERELARELARRLPIVLRIAGDELPIAETLEDDEDLELAEAQPTAPPARRRASRA